MLSINKTPFNAAYQVGVRLQINPQIQDKYDISRRGEFMSYKGCRFEVVATKQGTPPQQDIILMQCTVATDRHPQHMARLYRRDFALSDYGSAGNIAVILHNGVCHACGVDSKDCWNDWANHLVCQECRARDAKPPYDYGRGKSNCCFRNKCGELTDAYAEDVMAVYNRAVYLQAGRYNG